jgi:hypothetical protein
MIKKVLVGAIVGVALSGILVACGGGGGGGTGLLNGGFGGPLLGTIVVPGISSAVSYSFDLGAVDAAAQRYYVTDRTNKSVDVVDTSSLKVIAQQQNGYAGCFANSGAPSPNCLAVSGSAVNNDASGPDGLDVVGNNLFVGDVNSLKVVNKTTGALVKTIGIGGTSKLRADEGCYDAVDNIYAISSPGEDPPFMTVVDAANFNVLATVYFQSKGLEACVYDPTSKNFFVNNDGSAAHPRGELSGYSAATFNALKATATATGPGTQYNFPGAALTGLGASPGAAFPGTTVAYDLGACDPTGLAIGPGNDIGSMCRQGTVGETLTFEILDRTSGTLLKTVPAGGGDQITYDAGTNKWFLADSRWTATGTSCGAGSANCPLTPMLGVVDGTTRTLLQMVPNGNNAHSVAVLPGKTAKVFTPFTAPTASGGGASFPDGGINVYSFN